MATPGARVSHGAWCTVSKAWRSMPRQVGVAGYSPTPRKRCDISSRIAAAHGQARVHDPRSSCRGLPLDKPSVCARA